MLAEELAGRYGTVQLRDHYWTAPDGTQQSAVTGRITVVAAFDALGFDVTNRDSNWLVKIAGATGVVVLPGCAVLGFDYSETTGDTPAYYKVP